MCIYPILFIKILFQKYQYFRLFQIWNCHNYLINNIQIYNTIIHQRAWF